MGDFSGNPTEPLKPLKDRKFIQIDRDNFNDVMARMTPGLNLKVENTLKGDGSEMARQLKFKSMEDFEPGEIVEQVEPLRKLLETRDKLRDLMTKVDRSRGSRKAARARAAEHRGAEEAVGELGIKLPARQRRRS